MPRRSRVDAPGALHHIIVRGIERRAVFRDDADREKFIEKLGTVLAKSLTACFAYALMRNHVHLLLRTGTAPLATVMRRLLTGYAMYFNRRYRRHGHLFQNRYKSILCEEETYLKELVRYIHLNPLRAKAVDDLKTLREYRFCGHGALLGRFERSWLDGRYVLKAFAEDPDEARQRYEEFVSKAAGEGRRDDLTGGGVLRSIGGWEELKRQRRGGGRIKGDERILGGPDFVHEILRHANEEMTRRAKIRTRGLNFKALSERIAAWYNIDIELLSTPTKDRKVSRARAILCYLAVRQLMMSGADVARELNLSPSMVSRAVGRGCKHKEAELILERYITGMNLFNPGRGFRFGCLQ
jgi:REP element-mobilizing transposase RayT